MVGNDSQPGFVKKPKIWKKPIKTGFFKKTGLNQGFFQILVFFKIQLCATTKKYIFHLQLMSSVILSCWPKAVCFVFLQSIWSSTNFFHANFTPQLLLLKGSSQIFSCLYCFKTISDWIGSPPRQTPAATGCTGHLDLVAFHFQNWKTIDNNVSELNMKKTWRLNSLEWEQNSEIAVRNNIT